MIYLLKSANLFKVGYTKNLKQRLSAYRTQNPHIEVIADYYGDLTFEKYFHKNFGDAVVGKEWYNYYDGIVEDFEIFYKKYIDTYYDHVQKEDYFVYKGFYVNMQNLIDSGFTIFAFKNICERNIRENKKEEVYSYVAMGRVLAVYSSYEIYEEDFINLGYHTEFFKPKFKLI